MTRHGRNRKWAIPGLTLPHRRCDTLVQPNQPNFRSQPSLVCQHTHTGAKKGVDFGAVSADRLVESLLCIAIATWRLCPRSKSVPALYPSSMCAVIYMWYIYVCCVLDILGVSTVVVTKGYLCILVSRVVSDRSIWNANHTRLPQLTKFCPSRQAFGGLRFRGDEQVAPWGCCRVLPNNPGTPLGLKA